MTKKPFIYLLIALRRFSHGLLDPVLRHSHIVHGTKALLLFFAFILIAVIIIMPLFDTKKDDLIPAAEDHNPRRATTPTMMNPHFKGTDKQHRPFHIEADAAVKTEEDKVSLTNVLADLELDITRWVKAKAVQAVYSINNHQLDLLGNIHIDTDDGYELDTSSAHIDLNSNTTTGKMMVTVQGNAGALTAQQFRIEDDNRIYFSDHVKMILYPKAAMEEGDQLFDPTSETLPGDTNPLEAE